MSRIRVLSEHLTNMIAAGEVVERPAGIVKECIENSIDAHSKVIEIEAFQGGIERLIITDDGIGMDYEDAHMAFMRHATSKMQYEQDLFNIQTMGFRGEAIPSIASVAKVELMTNDGNSGTLIRYEYGELTCEETCSCPLGTKFDISGLFVKTPARFKHLKSPSYEFSIIADLVNKMALSHPEIRFKLSHDGRVVFQTSGKGDLNEIIFQMYGKEVASNTIPFDASDDDFRIHGLLVQPKINRATKYFMFIALNTRLIRSVKIQKAIIDAYGNYMPVNRFPIVILNIEMDTQLVDVNVHPNKWEVRLSKQNQLIELIKTTIRTSLNDSLRTVNVKPVVKQKPVIEQEELDFTYTIPEPVIYEPIRKKENDFISKQFDEIKEEHVVYQVYEEPKEEEVIQVDENTGAELFKHIKVLAQLHDSYILCENEQGLVIIDQHAAQERYHYEQIQKSLNSPCTMTQPLMLPIQINVTSDLMSRMEVINQKVQYFGFEFEAFGDDQFIVREIPVWFQNVHEDQFFNDLLDYFKENDDVDMKQLRKHVLATMACHSSIRFHRPLTMQEMQQVVYDLQKCEQPYHCPHGRPTVITMSDNDLRKEFERG